VFDAFHILRPYPNFKPLSAMLAFQELSGGLSLQDVLQNYTLSAARAIFEDDILGSIEPGKMPGLILLSNTDTVTLRLTKNSTIKVLV
jgi:predicted amidohydrolase YtcJ